MAPPTRNVPRGALPDSMFADGTCPLVRHGGTSNFQPARRRGILSRRHWQARSCRSGRANRRFPGSDRGKRAREDVSHLPQRSLRYGIICKRRSRSNSSGKSLTVFVRAILIAMFVSSIPFVSPRKTDSLRYENSSRLRTRSLWLAAATSNNTHQLVATCRAANKIVFHIERAEELRPEWFSGTEIIGLTAGTSTLPETVAAVHARLLQIAGGRS